MQNSWDFDDPKADLSSRIGSTRASYDRTPEDEKPQPVFGLENSNIMSHDRKANFSFQPPRNAGDVYGAAAMVCNIYLMSTLYFYIYRFL